MTQFSGPMFEPATSKLWESIHKKEGAHYNNFGCHDKDGMEALRVLFPDGEACDEGFILFSTSGVHGRYDSIEDCQKWVDGGQVAYDDQKDPEFLESSKVTFLVVQPRICCLRHGNCEPRTDDDFDFLKKLRLTSWAVMLNIGRHTG